MQDGNSRPAPPRIPVAPRREMPTSMLSSGGEDATATHRTLHLAVLDGALPEDLRGHVFVAGSIATPGRPAFSGEGTMYRLDLGAGGVSLKQTVFRPPCFRIDHALQGGDHGGLLSFHDLGLTRMSPILGVRSVLSNSPLPLRDRMLVTTDAGRPWEFDPVTLELVTPIGTGDEWLGSIPAPWLFPLVLTSAHPAEDRRTGELFSVNYANPLGERPGFCHLVRWREAGALEHFALIDPNGDPVVIEQCVHQLAVTRNHVVLQDSAFVVELGQMAIDAADLLLPGMPVSEMFGEHDMNAQRPTTVLWLVPRAALQQSGGGAEYPTPVPAVRVEIPGESVHFFAQYEDSQALSLIVPHTPTLDVSEWVRQGERMVDGSHASHEIAGMQVPCALRQGTIAVHTIDPRTGLPLDARRTQGEETWGLALGAHAPVDDDHPIDVVFFNTSGFAPELVPQRVLKAYADRVDLAMTPVADGRPPRLLDFEVATGRLVSYECPRGWSLLSPCFVPRGGGGPRDGYVVCLAHAADSVPRERETSGEEVWVFDAADITRGPLCRLGHEELDFAFTVHSAWVPELRPSRRDYAVSVADDLDLDYVQSRMLGPLSFWGVFSAAVSAAMQRDVVERLLVEDVLPHFAPR